MKLSEKARKNISEIIFGKTRKSILGLFYGNQGASFYLHQIARETGCAIGAVQRELKLLENTGVLKRTDRDRRTYYRMDEKHPLFEELRSLVLNTSSEKKDLLKSSLLLLNEHLNKITEIFDLADQDLAQCQAALPMLDQEAIIAYNEKLEQINSKLLSIGTTISRLQFQMQKLKEKVKII